MSLLDEVAEFKRSKEDNYLIEKGVINHDGTVTADGWNLVAQVVFEEKKQYVLELLQNVDLKKQGLLPDEESNNPVVAAKGKH